MARYVDADKLKQDLVDLYDFAKWDPREIHFSLFDMVANIDGEPTADVAPVVHAHWRWMPNYDVICTKCQYVLPSGSPVSDFRFCPYCGAKMDEE